MEGFDREPSLCECIFIVPFAVDDRSGLQEPLVLAQEFDQIVVGVRFHVLKLRVSIRGVATVIWDISFAVIGPLDIIK